MLIPMALAVYDKASKEESLSGFYLAFLGTPFPLSPISRLSRLSRPFPAFPFSRLSRKEHSEVAILSLQTE